MNKTIAYALVDEKGNIISFPMEIHIRLYKEKKDAIFYKEESEKIIKVEIKKI